MLFLTYMMKWYIYLDINTLIILIAIHLPEGMQLGQAPFITISHYSYRYREHTPCFVTGLMYVMGVGSHISTNAWAILINCALKKK